MSKEIYYESILHEIPRLLGLCDRNAASSTYGCFDRHYWNALDADFPCARYQEAVLALSLLHVLKRDDNPYYNNENILGWINAALEFWSSIQERGGGFNEMYPHENAIVAAAFSAYAVSESMLVLGEQSIGMYARILDSLCRAGDWLIPRVDGIVVNQTAGSVIALYNIHLLTRDERYRTAAQDKIDFIGKAQDEEGWFAEDGGADIGYLSLAIDYLAKYYDKSKDERALAILRKAISFIAPFINPNSTLGGSCGSRNTEYVVPSGFEIMARYCPEGRAVARMLRKAIQNGGTVVPSCLDDRYLAYMGYTYLQAYVHACDADDAEASQDADLAVHYPHAGITIRRNTRFHLAHNFMKGGAFKILFPNGRGVDDWGIVLIAADGKRYHSAWVNPRASFKENRDGSLLESETCFRRVTQLLATPCSYALFRMFLSTLGSSERISGHFRAFIRKLLIPRDTARSPFTLTRRVLLDDEGITVNDLIDHGGKARKVIIGAKATFIYVLSTHYHLPVDLNRPVFTYAVEGGKGVTLRIVRRYSLAGDLRGIDIG
ncbi:MAG TPA: hypothetical protein PK696_06010 [bacterium]|nr:hypothetical protein [bacterium]